MRTKTEQQALKAIENAMECGSYTELLAFIDILERALKEIPEVRVDHFVPGLLEQMKAVPAPQTWIDMNKARLKFDSDDAFEEHLNRSIRRNRKRK
jgi:hypothetical protein